MSKKKPVRARTERREAARASQKLADERMALARLLPGGTPDNPIEVATASVIEVRALSAGCAVCGGTLQLDEHRAEDPVRIVIAHCRACGRMRVSYFRVAQALLH